MRRRLAAAILLTVWAMLIIGGGAVYLGVRSILINDLDSLLYARASALPELLHPAGFDLSRVPVYDWRDRYVIRQSAGGGGAVNTPATQSSRGSVEAVPPPKLLDARFTTDANRQRWRTVILSAVAPSSDLSRRQPVTLEYSGKTDRIDRLLERVATALLVFGVVAGALTAGVSLWVSRVVLRPLQSAARWLSSIDEQTLDARVSLKELPAELLPVSDRLNEMLSKLQQAFEGQKQFLATASHELRTPVAALETELAAADSLWRDGGEASRKAIAQSLAQVRVLRALVDRLSEFISDARRAAHLPAAVDVVAVVIECADAAAILGRASHVSVTRMGPSQLRCVLPVGRLRSILSNLLCNAVEYNRPGGTVDISFFHDGRLLHLRVGDDGPGVTPDNLPHLFKPFYRVADESVSGGADVTSGHLGLGLFIVQAHVKALGGVARVDSRSGKGTAVEVEFPCEAMLPQALVEEAVAAG